MLGTDLRETDPEATPAVVVATQGVWDEEALAAASCGMSPTSGLSRLPTRAAVVRAWLRDEGAIPDERLAALRAPAGLDLGAETAEEIALSILAELVQVRRGTADFVAAPGAGDAGRRSGRCRRSSRSSTTSSCSIRSAG